MTTPPTPASTPANPQNFDAEITKLLADGDTHTAAERIIQHHGQALYGYIYHIVHNADAAADAFQIFSVRLWQGLAQFRGQSKLKTWLYTVARNAALRHLQNPQARRAVALDTQQEAHIPAAPPRTVTDAWQRTAEKQKLWSLIEALPHEDRELLSLRLTHALPWLEIAQVLSPPNSPQTALRQHAAALRKRFERLKTSLGAHFSADET